MLAAGAAAATGCRSATAAATASGSGCPRLTDGAVRLKDPILDYRSDDLTATDRGHRRASRGAEAKSRPRFQNRLGPYRAHGGLGLRLLTALV